jgi:hypothetical protein
MALARFTGVSDEYELLKSEVDVLASKVDGVYGLLPANVGSVLVDEEMYRLIAAHPSKLDLGLVENRNNPPEVNRYLDEWFTPGLLYYQATNRSMYELNDDELALARRIESGRYDMIFVSPSERETQIYYALRNVTPEYISRYCIVFLPNYKDSKTMRHWSTMIFRNWADCDSVLSSSRGYYLSQFDDVCALSEWSANDLLKGMFVANRAPEAFTLNCTSGSDLPSRMLKLEQQYKNTDLKVPAIMLFGILWYLLLTFGRIDENGKKT